MLTGFFVHQLFVYSDRQSKAAETFQAMGDSKQKLAWSYDDEMFTSGVTISPH
jgi:hypothetical protein